MLLAFLTMCFLTTFMFTQLSSPLGLGAAVVIFSFFVSVSMALVCYTSWFSLLLFMLFLSGMMIIFIYVCSLASNETHFYSVTFIYLVMAFTFFMVFSYEVNKLMGVSGVLVYMSDSAILMCKVYSFSVYTFIVLLITYLLVTLIVVVKICVISDGPVRIKK
uniref:NADH dehydrogenase subunit 6 n=1 Tax=Hyalella tiwanaku TaxID=2759786 RepID=A0A7T8V7A1_9CRUS|nr:NADH dehydrogenase subunit 6 [Hyalella tiwanaku]